MLRGENWPLDWVGVRTANRIHPLPNDPGSQTGLRCAMLPDAFRSADRDPRQVEQARRALPFEPEVLSLGLFGALQTLLLPEGTPLLWEKETARLWIMA